MSQPNTAVRKFDLRDLRNAFGAFLTGVTVVSCREPSETPRGFTANSFTSVSLEPPLILICVDKTAESVNVFSGCPGFVVNILSETQADISALFASKRADKFDLIEWQDSPLGYPVLQGVCAWFECKRHQVIDAGDHVIILGAVTEYHHNNLLGLGYVRGGYLSLGFEHSAVRAAPDNHNAIVGAIIECDGKILLCEDTKSTLVYVPASGLTNKPASLKNLEADLLQLGIEISIHSLFAVFEDKQTEKQSIYYRATCQLDTDGPLAKMLYTVSDIPWEKIKSTAIQGMLKRYIRESSNQRFGVYFGNEQVGQVKTLTEQDEPLL